LHLSCTYFGDRVFSRTCSDGTRGNGFTLKEGWFRLDIRKKFFMLRVVKPWPRLPREVRDASDTAADLPAHYREGELDGL